MADKTETVTNSPEQGQQIERAQVAPDGTVTVPNCEAKLTSVDVADVDLLLGFADGTYVVIPNGALDALSDALHTVVFVDKDDSAFDEAHFSSDHQTSLGDLFKMVGTTDLAKAGSLRVVSEHVDADIEVDEVVTASDQTSVVLPGLVQVSTGGNGPGGGPLITNAELINPESTDPVAPDILQRPSPFVPGREIANTAPTIRLDANITADDIINISESDPANMVTITGSVGGSAVIGDTVTVTVGSYTVTTQVLDSMTFSVDVPGDVFVPTNLDPTSPGFGSKLQIDDMLAGTPISARIDAQDGKNATDTEDYNIDNVAPEPMITLDPIIADDDVVNIAESLETVTITGTVNETSGSVNADIAGDLITLTINGTDVSGFVNPDGQTFSIDVPGNLLAPSGGVEGVTGTIDARIDAVDIAGNSTFTVDSEAFAIDTQKPIASIQLDTDIAGDGTVNFAESTGNVTITGTVGLDVQAGDTVTLTLGNGAVYTGLVLPDGQTFNISVLGSDLAFAGDGSTDIINASVEAFDTAGNSFIASTSESYDIAINLPVPEIYLDTITGDDVINQVEAGATDIAITGWVAGDAQIGDRISITVNGNLVAEGFVSSDLTFSINVAGSDLAAVGDGNSGSVDATITTAGTGGAASDTVSGNYLVDLTSAIPTITVDDIAIDNMVNIAEATADVAVTGSAVGAQVGDEVTLTINNTDYAGLLRPDGSFSINVLGSDLVGDYLAGDSSIAASVTTYDAAGNPGTGSVDKAYGVDIVRPMATIDIDDTSLNIGDSALVTITFDNPVTDFTNADLTIENGTLTLVSSTDGGTTWTATLTPNVPIEDTTNVITLNDAGVTDLAGNTGAGTTDSNNYAIDTISPTVNDVQVSDLLLTDADVGGSFSVDVTFSEVMDTAVAPALTFGTGGSGSLVFTGGVWDGTGTTYTATYGVLDDGFDISGVTVDISGALDANGNAQIDYAEQPEFRIDTLNPSVSITEDNVDGVVSPTDNVVNYTLIFSEEVVSLTASDLTISGGTLTSGPVLAADGLSSTFSVIAYDKSIADLVVTVEDSVVDLNGNLLIPASNTLPVDTLNPRVTIAEDNADGIVSDSDNVVNYTLTFSAEVISVTAADLTIIGGALTGGPIFAADGLSATFSVTAFDNSDVDLSVTVNDTIVDLVGRSLVPATNTLTVDTENVTVILAEDNVDGIVSFTDNIVNYTLTFSEEIASISASDLMITGGVLTGGLVLAADGLSATLSVTAFDNSTDDLVVTVNDSVLDLNGNTLIPASNTLAVDTYSPTATATLTDPLLTDTDSTFGVVVLFNEGMDPSVFPTLVFSEDTSGSLVKSYEGWFNNNTKLVVIYDVIDANVDLSNITIDVTGGEDINGNSLQDQVAIVEFGIDTLNPTVNIAEDNADGVVSDIDNVVNYTLTFTEEVASITASDLTVNGGVLTSGPILAADGLSATFTVIAFDESTTDLVVTVNNSIVDLNGNPLNPASNTLTVDTVNYFPDFEASLYTSPEFKVTGGTGAPAGSYVDGATYAEHLQASSPAGQATRERIDGTTGADTIVHNPAFSADASRWSKTLHLDFTVFTELTTIELVADPAISSIPGFSVEGGGVAWDGLNTWTLNPDAVMSADLLLNGLDLNIVYDVADTGGPVDFDIVVNVDGKDGAIDYNANKALDFTWRDAVTEADFAVIEAGTGDHVMVLPRAGLGVDIYAGDGSDTVSSGAGDDTVYGDAGDDTIDGGTGNDLLYGGADGDTIAGGDGDDTVYGETGDDNIDGGTGNDLLFGGVGADIIDGGIGNDTVSFVGSIVDNTASLATGLGAGGDAAGDEYYNIENLTGGDGADRLIGDGNDNILDGGDGDDTLIGGAALTGDTMIGGIGNDTVSYAGSVDAVNASLVTNTGSGGDAAGDSYSEIENLTGGAGADTLIGDGNDNVLNGGADGDNLQGGGGIDTASYADASSGVIAALDSSLWMFQSGDALGDTFDQIENLLGSNHNDTLFGDSSDNSLDGGLGNDTLNAGAGDDTIYANQGNDTARGGVGNDTIHVSSDGVDLPVQVDGGAGTDVLVVEGLVNVVSNYDFTDLAGLDSRLENIETLDIRGDGADSLIEITGQDVLNMVDTGTQLTVLADSGDTLDLAAFGAEGEGVTSVAIADGTEYTIDVGGVDIATINWLTV